MTAEEEVLKLRELLTEQRPDCLEACAYASPHEECHVCAYIEWAMKESVVQVRP